MTFFPDISGSPERKGARAFPVAKYFLAIAVAFLPATTVTAGSAALDDASIGSPHLLIADGRNAESRKRDAERAELNRREMELDRLRNSHEEWRRRLEVLRQEQRHRAMELDVPPYNPGQPARRR